MNLTFYFRFRSLLIAVNVAVIININLLDFDYGNFILQKRVNVITSVLKYLIFFLISVCVVRFD